MASQNTTMTGIADALASGNRLADLASRYHDLIGEPDIDESFVDAICDAADSFDADYRHLVTLPIKSGGNSAYQRRSRERIDLFDAVERLTADASAGDVGTWKMGQRKRDERERLADAPVQSTLINDAIDTWERANDTDLDDDVDLTEMLTWAQNLADSPDGPTLQVVDTTTCATCAHLAARGMLCRKHERATREPVL